jgi:acyl-CoA synthetase (AMP-forming)/AMP-acid ligase II
MCKIHKRGSCLVRRLGVEATVISMGEVPSDLVGTLSGILRSRAACQSQECVYTFLHGDEEQSLTYEELDRMARATAAVLLQFCSSGDRALLIYPPGLDYIVALHSCMYAGVIAVPSYAPRPNRPMSRLESIVASAEPAIVLTTRAMMEAPKSVFRQQDGLLSKRTVLATDEVEPNPSAEVSVPISSATPVILQYTSGSTAFPKGVTLTHGNLLHNLGAIERNFPLDATSSTVFWLPPYHDMGLIGGLLQPLYTGFPVHLMSPVAFLQRPARWLQAISEFRATCSGGPNFAYDLCVRRVSEEEINDLDLSSWKVAFNGAEPIRQQTLDDFCNKFSRCGFERSSFHPCYGLAESTLMTTGMDRPGKDRPDNDRPDNDRPDNDRPGTGLQLQKISRSAMEKDRITSPVSANDEIVVVSSGCPAGDLDVRVVNPATAEELPVDRVGEIWIAGASVAAGYWGRPNETEETFHAKLASGEGPFLRSGDLGFLRDGQIYITGRIKDLIIIRGQNYYPHDLEFTAQRCHSTLQPASGAAFSLDRDGAERVVLVQEVDARTNLRDQDEIITRISAAITETHDLHVDEVVLVKPFTLPRTTSGKMQRYLCRSAYLSGTLQTLT